MLGDAKVSPLAGWRVGGRAKEAHLLPSLAAHLEGVMREDKTSEGKIRVSSSITYMGISTPNMRPKELLSSEAGAPLLFPSLS